MYSGLAMVEEEQFAQAAREAGKGVSEAERELARAEAIEKRVYAQAMINAEAQGHKTGNAQMRQAVVSLVVEQREVHGRNPGEDGHAVARHHFEGGTGLETGHQGEGTSGGQHAVLDHRLAKGVEERERGQGHLVEVSGRHDLRDHEGTVEKEVGVGEFRALRLPRRPRGVENHGRIFGRGRMQTVSRRSFDHFLQGIAPAPRTRPKSGAPRWAAFAE